MDKRLLSNILVFSFIITITLTSSYAEDPVLEEFAGYPLCEDVISAAGLVGVPDEIRILNSTISERDREERAFRGCFGKYQNVLVLALHSKFLGLPDYSEVVTPNILSSGKSTEKAVITPVNLDYIRRKNWTGQFYILSSTLSVIENPEYQRDCWALVENVWYKKLKALGLQNQRLLELEKDGERLNITTTPQQRLYVSLNSGENMEWHWVKTEAIKIDRDTRVWSGENSTGFNIIKITEFPQDWFTRLYEGIVDSNPYLYSFTVPETFTYYVGYDLEARVLAHNIKEFLPF